MSHTKRRNRIRNKEREVDDAKVWLYEICGKWDDAESALLSGDKQ